MSTRRGPRPGVATLWFVAAADPSAVIAAEPGPDRGFGRKYLALLDPRLHVAPIGDFPLNRSAPAGVGEFYIGGFDGMAVVQTVIDDVTRPSELPERFRRGIAATDCYLIASDHGTGFGAFAHWRAGTLKRAFSATRLSIIEDIGVPEVFEGDFWAGRRRPTDDAVAGGGGVAMPFVPAELADAAAIGWLGFDPADPGPDIPVSAFAVDGRRATAHEPAGGASSRVPSAGPDGRGPGGAAAHHAAAGHVDYDDYEDHSAPAADGTADGLRRAGRIAADGAGKLGSGLAAWGRGAWARLQKRNRS